MGLKEELIAAIENEKNHFDMSSFVLHGTEELPVTCETACCMAGWICALRPEKSLAMGDKSIEYRAHTIWHSEGYDYDLDFYADGHYNSDLEEISRKDVLEYIRNGEWPIEEDI